MTRKIQKCDDTTIVNSTKKIKSFEISLRFLITILSFTKVQVEVGVSEQFKVNFSLLWCLALSYRIEWLRYNYK